MNALPRRALTDFDLVYYADKFKIPNFRGVFMRDNLPKSGPNVNECAIINLDSVKGSGTHWTAYKKNGDSVYYFDSFGDLQPARELVKYFHRGPERAHTIAYNYERKQKFDTVWCGHLCLKFLLNQSS